MGKLRCFLGFGPYLLKLGVVIQFSAFSHLLSVVGGGTFPRLSFVGPIKTLLDVSFKSSMFCPVFFSFLPREKKNFFLRECFIFFLDKREKKLRMSVSKKLNYDIPRNFFLFTQKSH